MKVVPLALRRLKATAQQAGERMAAAADGQANAVHREALEAFIRELENAGLSHADIQAAAQEFSDRVTWCCGIEMHIAKHPYTPSGADALRNAHDWRATVTEAIDEVEG